MVFWTEKLQRLPRNLTTMQFLNFTNNTIDCHMWLDKVRVFFIVKLIFF